jgi:glycosyltransferase involved in cell wall biosynthesis
VQEHTADPMPRVRVDLPVYNDVDHIAEAIESVTAQTYRDFELIICDNASMEWTGEVGRGIATRDPMIRCYRNPENLGASGNFRRTFELARGGAIA